MSLPNLYVTIAFTTVIYMSLWFALARARNRLDVVDSAWGIGFVVVALVSAIAVGQLDWTRYLTVILVAVWGLRLASHISSRNRGKSEDKRYLSYRDKWGKWFWPRAYCQIFLVQGVLLVLISTPVILLLQTSHAFNLIVAIIGFVVWASGIVIEATADHQIARFLASSSRKPGDLMTSGLWHYSRHPNYFGEITTWWGAAIVAVSAGQYLGILGAVLITFLIVKVSGIPLLEKSMAGRPGYAEYARRTSILIPLPPKR